MFDMKFTQNNLKELEGALPPAIEKALEACGLFAESEAKTLLTEQKAVDTGNLRNSVTYAVESNGKRGTMAVGTNVEYASYVENGTYKMRARPYVRPSISEHEAEYREIIKQNLQ